MLGLAADAGAAVLVVAGSTDPAVHAGVSGPGVAVVDLSERFGRAASMGDTAACIRAAVDEHLASGDYAS